MTSNLDWLTQEPVPDLLNMLAWWRSYPYDPVAGLKQRPIFKGCKRNTGVYVNERILQLAIEKAEAEKLRAGNLSRLVEILLWKYVGCPEEVLEGTETTHNG